MLSFCHWGSKTTQVSSCNWIVDGTLHFGNHSGVSYTISSPTLQVLWRYRVNMQTLHLKGVKRKQPPPPLCFLILIFWHRAPPQTQPNRKAAGWWPLRRNFYSSSFHFFYFTSSAVSGIEPGTLRVLENSPVFHPKWRFEMDRYPPSLSPACACTAMEELVYEQTRVLGSKLQQEHQVFVQLSCCAIRPKSSSSWKSP